MEKPVVATHTKAMNYLADYIYLGKTKEDYLSLIKRALIENSPEIQIKRKEFGIGHSWLNNVN